MMETKSFIAIGIVLAIIIGVTAVFFASSDPDGLESTALFVQGDKTLTGPSPDDGDPEAVGSGTFAYAAPMPDYALGEELGSLGAIIAIIVGILVAFALVFGVSKAVAASKQ
jgi:cobalt/nickel transport protein